MVLLRVTPALGEPFDFRLGDEAVVIGRSSDSELVISDRFLSRQHARLFRRGETVLIEDLGSRNGTLLNESPVRRPTPIKAGDIIKLSASVISIVETTAGVDSSSDARKGLGEMTVFRPASDLIDTGPTADMRQIRDEKELRRFAARLRLVNEVHQALSRPILLDQLLELILDRAFEHLNPEEGLIYLRQPGGALEPAAKRSVPGHPSDYLYSRTLIHEVAEKGLAAVVLDTHTDERFAASDSIMTSGVRSLVAAPLLDAEGSMGMIVLSSRAHVRQFSEQDMEVLASLALAAALRIRNIRDSAERLRLQEELALARRIQTALLPNRLPDLPGYELHGGNLPSREVSGDYYEVRLRREASECVLMIVDVAGKGVAASLLTAALVAMSAGPIEEGLPPDKICDLVSRLLLDRTPPERYATAFLAILDPASGTVRYVNAGHNPCLVVRASGEVEQLTSGGPPLGCLAGSRFAASETRLAAGDTLVLYTDGITETVDPKDLEFGLDRLVRFCQAHRELPLQEMASSLDAELQRFAKGAPPIDDRTLLMARRLP